MLQVFSMTHKGELRREEGCLAANGNDGAKVTLEQCPIDGDLPGKMWWSYERSSGHVKHLPSGRCLDVEHLGAGDEIQLADCKDSDTQKFIIETMLE